LAGGEVAVAGTGDQFAFAPGRNDVDLYGTESAVLFGVGGIVAEGVLIANVAGDLIADIVNVVHIFRKEGYSTGGGGNIFQGAHGFLAILLVLIAEETDRVDDHVGLLDFAHGFFKTVTADVVYTIGDDQQNLLVLVALLKVIERADDGVVERGAAASVNAFECFLKFGDAAGEILVEIEIVVVVEINDEGFVLGIGGLDESQGSFIDARALVAHGAAVVDHQAHADRDVFAFEEREFLFSLVFEDAEIVFLEAVNEFAAIVEDSGVEDDQVDVNFYGSTLLVGALIGRRRPGVGEGQRIILREGGGNGEEQKRENQKERGPDGLRYRGGNLARTSDWGRNSRSCCRR
jgi:hypothetical protein